MNRAVRNAKRIRAELRKAHVASRLRAKELDSREDEIASALSAHNRRESLALEAAARSAPARALLVVVRERAPRLVTPDYLPVLEVVASLPHTRPIDAWEPRAKGRSTRFQSLVEHLFASCPVPSVLWRGFFETDVRAFAPLVVWVASGGSLFQFAKTRFAIPLTRKMCHVALATRNEPSLLRAMRRAEVLALGGSASLASAWASSVHASALASRETEAFFIVVLEWLVSREHRAEDLGVIFDYAVHRHREDASFSMKGRTVDAFLRDARAWHAELAHLRNVRHFVFRPSGFLPVTIERKVPKRVVWRVEEIKTSHELFDEGRRMGHCVYSYAHAVESGGTSIWVMTMEDGEGPTGRWAMLTIEVRNALRAIVQARGRFNRMPTAEERTILARWAASNGLKLV